LAQQLPLPFELRPALTREDFIVAPSNAAAVRFIDTWPNWPARRGGLYGPEACGKSHLVEVWRAASGAIAIPAAALTPDWVVSVPADAAIAIENVDAKAAEPTEERDIALLVLFERPQGSLLFTGIGPPAVWRAVTGDIRSRFDALLSIAMDAPDDILLGALARKLFADRQLPVPEGVIRRMLTALERTPAAISAFVDAADRKALAERRPISERLVLELLDGRPGSA
jgi:chromosomal replication initiation ATPase DnaA